MRTSFSSLLVALATIAVSVQGQNSSSSASSAASSSTGSASASGNSTSSLTASSNFTLPNPTASATFPPGFVMQSSVPFVYTDVDTANLPKINYSLLNETVAQRQIICSQQTKFCSTAGCADADAKIKENFCDVDTMAIMCTCTKGSTNLKQWNWPAQFQDCLRRGNTCTNACQLPGGTTQARNDCKDACTKSFGGTCGFANQYSANYAVSKPGQKPNLQMVQGGTAGNGAMSMNVASGAVLSVAAIAALVLSV
ncbi:uncharacterized protein FA14DRAFT_161448 [Meira miltonrushii]|uniref:DUF7707 domain-containing protein n=1 Tax=Meira miltonrushii TaxID=1280837 RepID=A0A316V812_9BASI|nr:uncharacterized protein FA14DRAFT_161448 [Meira miltonrushii]PWN33759.1 hypothetical protein FA14DRAFT_161448 [Meira miltonrushii]